VTRDFQKQNLIYWRANPKVGFELTASG